MKLLTALEIGKSCELETVGEAIFNIRLHVTNLFNYDEIQTEYNELCNDYKEQSKKHGFSLDTKINDVIKTLDKI